MTDIVTKDKPEPSEDFKNLIEELKKSFISSADIGKRIFEQGKKNGLSNKDIRIGSSRRCRKDSLPRELVGKSRRH